MSTALGLAMQISANTAQLAQAVADVNKRLDSMGEAGRKAANDLGTLKNIEIGKIALGGLRAATTAFTSLSGAVIGAATSVARFALDVGNQLDELNDVANRTGVGVEAIQAYGGAAKLAGTDVETFARSLQKLTINIGQAASNEEARKKFEELGLVFDDLRAKSPEQQFEAVYDAIAQIADPAERAAAAVSVFGKTGIELGPLFTEGPGALTRIREEAQRLGQVVSQEAITNIGSMNDAFDKVGMTIRGLTGQILGELAGPIAEIANQLLGLIERTGPQAIAQNIAQGLLDFIQLAGNAFIRLAEFIEAFVTRFGPILGIDIRSEAQKELDRIRQKQAGTTEFVEIGGRVVPRFTPGELTADERSRLAELEKQVAAEAAGGVLRQFQANFNDAIDAASQSLQAKVDARLQAGVTDTEVEQRQLDTLEDIKKNTKVSTVEILR